MKYLFLIILAYPAYIIGNWWIDMRIETLRTPINNQAIVTATKAAVETYEFNRALNETLLERKRKVRDKKLQEYADKLDRILELK